MIPSSPTNRAAVLPHHPVARARRAAEAGIGRPGGLLVAALSAAVVFGIGQRLLPWKEVEAPPPASAPAPPPPPAPPPQPVSAPPSAPPPQPVSAPPSAPTSAPGATQPPDRGHFRDDDERQTDKDLAREAWRRNRPDVSADAGKASILIPLKGSIAGASLRVTNRPHAVIVTLPSAASLITMRVYRVRRDGFRLLWIDQAEKDANPKDGTSLKIGLADLGDPIVEIKDDFVRVTVHRTAPGAPSPEGTPTPKSAPAPEPAPSPALRPSADSSAD